MPFFAWLLLFCHLLEAGGIDSDAINRRFASLHEQKYLSPLLCLISMNYQQNIMTVSNGKKHIPIISPNQGERPSWSSFNPANPGSDSRRVPFSPATFSHAIKEIYWVSIFFLMELPLKQHRVSLRLYNTARRDFFQPLFYLFFLKKRPIFNDFCHFASISSQKNNFI